MKKVVIVILLTIGTHVFSTAQLNIDSLFLASDSLNLIFTGFSEEETYHSRFSQSFCDESPFHYSTTSKELIKRTLNTLNFRISNEILFCGFDYEIYGFKDTTEVFKMLYNTECNFASIGSEHFWSDTLRYFEGLKEFLRFSESHCEFRTPELTDCFVESLLTDDRIELLSFERINDIEIFYRLTSKAR